MLTNHPFVATPDNGPCSSCGRGRGDAIHRIGFDSAMRAVETRFTPGATNLSLQGLQLAEVIRDLGETQTRTLFSALMTRMDHDRFEKLIRQLVRVGFVEQSSHQLRWIGPKEGE